MTSSRAWGRFGTLMIAAGLTAGACITVEDSPAAVGLAGETCRARDDCSNGLQCLDRKCREAGWVREAGTDTGTGDGSADSAADRTSAERDGATDVTVGDATDAAHASADSSPDSRDAQSDAPQLSEHGEPCNAKKPCIEPFTCVREVCVGSENGLTPTGRRCDIIECTQPIDCCPPPEGQPPNCEQLQLQCDQGFRFSCEKYDTKCDCSADKWRCDDEVCRWTPTCSASDDCIAPEQCVSGHCVECANASECGSGYDCLDGECVVRCAIDEHCSFFHECQSGECVRVGCMVDSECRAWLKTPHAACIDGSCRSDCVRDADCNSAVGAVKNVCHRGFCIPFGCETDQACRIELEAYLSGNSEAECRP